MADLRTNDMQEIQAVFNSFGVRLILVYGALLGHYRDKNFLPGDDDVDFCVIDKIDLQTRKHIGWVLFDLGYEPQPIAFNVFGRHEASVPGYNGDAESGIIVCQKNFKFTIFFFKEEQCPQHGSEYVCIPMLGAMKLISTPARFYDKLEQIKIGKGKYLIPSPIEDYLADTYFNNWQDRSDRRHGLLYTQQHENS
jgi:hypothetical protein